MRNFVHMKVINIIKGKCTVKPVYKDHIREPDNMVFMSRCPLYRG